MTRKWICQNCRLEKIKQQARVDGLVVSIQTSIDDAGFDVFVHPDDVVIPPHVYRRDEDDLPEKKYWKLWLFSNYKERGCECDE
jgi:hypothetical protein